MGDAFVLPLTYVPGQCFQEEQRQLGRPPGPALCSPAAAGLWGFGVRSSQGQSHVFSLRVCLVMSCLSYRQIEKLGKETDFHGFLL